MLKEGKPERVIKTYTKAELEAKYGAENVVEVKPKSKLVAEDTTEETIETGLESKINKLNADLEKAKYEAEEATGDQLNPYLATIESLKTIKINTVSAKTETGGKVGGKQDINIGRVSNSSTWTVSKLAERLYEENSENIPNFEEQDYKDFIIEMLTAGSLIEKESEILGGDVAEIQQELNEALREHEQLLKEAKAKPSKDTKYLTVKHTNLGFNNDGTFTNIDGANILDHSSQLLAMILDIVKEGIPFNVNTYTFSSYITMLNTGVDIRYASMFIRQPILKDLSETFFETQGFIEDDRTGKEIEITKNKYVKRLFEIGNDLGLLAKMPDAQYKALTDAYAKGKDISLSRAELTKYFGLDLENKAFDIQELKSNIKHSVTPTEKVTENQELEYLKKQIRVIEAFKVYKKAGEAFDDVANATGTDRTQVGPSLTRPETLNRQIEKATYYLRRTSLDKTTYLPDATIIRFNGEIMTLDALRSRQKSEESLPAIKRTIKLDSVIDIEKGARIWSKVNDKFVPATKAIFPKLFESDSESKYPVLETYYEEGFRAANEILSPLFIKQSVAFKEVIFQTINDLGIPYNSEIIDKISTYLSSYVQKNLEWFRDRNENTVLGLDNIPIKTNNNISIEEFNKLSTANKVTILQSKMQDKLADDMHILNYLKPKIGQKDIEKNSMHIIEFINTKTDSLLDDSISDSFMEMWAGDDPFQKSLARDLVQYSFLTTGLSMRKNSFSKLIPTQIYKDIGLDTYLYTELNKAKVDTRFNKEFMDFRDKFLRSNWNNPKIVPYVYTKYKSGTQGPINNTPNWDTALNPVTGIITVLRGQLLNEDLQVQQAPYITVPKYKIKDGKKVKVDNILYARFDDGYGKIYYYPVDKLGGVNLIEFTKNSKLEKNQVERTAEEYERSIIDNNNYGMNDTNANHHSYRIVQTGINDRNQADKFMFTNATSFIGKESAVNINKSTPLNKFLKSFKDKSNLEIYSEQSQVMVSMPTNINSTSDSPITTATLKGQIFEKTKNGSIRIRGNSPYSKIYTVLKSGGTVMFKSPIDASGNAVQSYNKDNELGNNLILTHLEQLRKDNAGVLFKQIKNDVVFYSKTPFDSNSLSSVQKDALKDNKNYKPNEGCQ
jgi:hypothetical protein